ncbi:MAG TPA: hypothetical protein VFX61_15415 [Micromonosporaceae bacterium]|nr:hypothetical protein [Micromonosporaceae bacterium]
MTAGQFREVDQNLLADYVGGALAGTPDEVVVARLIAEDRAWAEAYAALAPAVDEVREALAEWGTNDLAMPPEVVARLTDALATTDPIAAIDASASPPASTPLHGPRVPSQAGRGRPAASGAPPSGPRRPRARARRRRWPQWAGAITAAAAVATFATLVDFDSRSTKFDKSDADTAATQPEVDTLVAPESDPTRRAAKAAAERTVASGTNYMPATLADAIAAQIHITPTPAQQQAAAPLVQTGRAPGLDRLADDHALTACLDEVTRAHGRGPLSIDLVDLAMFEQAPAVVISFVDSTGERWAWVAGPACGSTGADTRYRTRVG